MKKHLFFLDPLEKLVIKKDSTLLTALSLKKYGHEVLLLFEKDFYLFNKADGGPFLDTYNFKGNWNEETFFVESFFLKEKKSIQLNRNWVIHMRLDPPFDSRYLRYLWMLTVLEKQFSVSTINSAVGILTHNEKLCIADRKDSLSIFVGANWEQFRQFCRNQMNQGYRELVVKPLDLYQGIGVEKISLREKDEILQEFFQKTIQNYKGPLVATPFLEDIYRGEIRSIFFRGRELGSIRKIPPKGSFLANIAQGASFSLYQLTQKQREVCKEISHSLADVGIEWIAFDLIGEYVSEVNVTCPGLLVEVSHAVGKNLAFDIASKFSRD